MSSCYPRFPNEIVFVFLPFVEWNSLQLLPRHIRHVGSERTDSSLGKFRVKRLHNMRPGFCRPLADMHFLHRLNLGFSPIWKTELTLKPKGAGASYKVGPMPAGRIPFVLQ